MKKAAGAFLFATMLLVGQHKSHYNDHDQNKNNGERGNHYGQNRNSVQLPEPSAIPEFILCLGAICFLALRGRENPND